jgi:hypothetical protein
MERQDTGRDTMVDLSYDNNFSTCVGKSPEIAGAALRMGDK